MSLFLSLRAMRVANKAAKIYRDATGRMPSPVDLKYLQESAYYGTNEKALAFTILLAQLKYEHIGLDASLVTEYRNAEDPLTKRIVRSLKWISEKENISDWQLEEFRETLNKMNIG